MASHVYGFLPSGRKLQALGRCGLSSVWRKTEEHAGSPAHKEIFTPCAKIKSLCEPVPYLSNQPFRRH
jgi:hypothetical protein